MKNYFVAFVLLIFFANACFAVGIELSDIIKEAREAEKLKVSQLNTTDEKLTTKTENKNTKRELNTQNVSNKKCVEH